LQRYTRTATDTVRRKILTWADVQEHRYCDQDNSKSWKRQASPWCGLGDATASMQAPQARGAYYLDAANAAAAI
jgi:hypothetical protein